MSLVRQRRLTRLEYDRLVERGFFHDERIELLDGLLVVREPQGSRHSTAVVRCRRALEHAFGRGYHARDQLPVALDDLSEPEPDVAIVRGSDRAYRDAHPTTPALVLEVSEGSLVRDRLMKGGLYARAGIREYWIVNLVDEVLEVYRAPVRAPGRRYGWKYASVRLLKPHAVVRPLAAPRARVRVADLLP